MNIFIMRHCTPVPGAQRDAQRGLTEAGKQQAREMGEFLHRQIGRVDIVISSDYARALETAEIIAPILGAHVAATRCLEPFEKPNKAWKDIERLAQQSSEVLIVGHHPEIAHLIDHIAGVHGIGHDFEHGSIAFITDSPAALHWMVTPELVEREIDTAMVEGYAAALPELLEARVIVEKKRSLRHPDHAKRIRPSVRKIRRIMAQYFEDQGRAIVDAVRPWVKLHMREAEETDAEKKKAAELRALDILPDSVVPLRFEATAAQAADYQSAIEQAIAEAQEQLVSEIGAGQIPQTALGRYLAENSLSKLTGEIADTTKQRLRDAIAQAVESGGTADDIVEAIEQTVDDFSTVRANMIAQTEVNDAYNASRSMVARGAGLNEKRWITESSAPCPECILNEAEGWIPIDENFPSGDDQPTAHPNCYCSLDFRSVTVS